MKRTFDVVEWNKGNKPPKSGEYLVTIGNAWVDVLFYLHDKDAWEFFSYDKEDYEFMPPVPKYTITAWAELPERYKEGEI